MRFVGRQEVDQKSLPVLLLMAAAECLKGRRRCLLGLRKDREPTLEVGYVTPETIWHISEMSCGLNQFMG